MAAGKPAITVEGGPQLRRAFKRLGDRADDLKDANQRAGEIVKSRASELVPRLDGDLAGTIRTDRRKTGASVLAGGRGGVVYAGPIHFGWAQHNIEPQPFLYDALADKRAEVIATYTLAIDELVIRFDVEAPD